MWFGRLRTPREMPPTANKTNRKLTPQGSALRAMPANEPTAPEN
jgi:hypothetical protein